jgi:hypothetical protein
MMNDEQKTQFIIQHSSLVFLRRFFGPEPAGGSGHLWPRWLFLRALGLIFFSAFYSLLFQIRGLIGPHGILPAGEFLLSAKAGLGGKAYWLAPTLFWFNSGDRFLLLVCWAGLVASLLLVINIWPRGAIAICLVGYLSFVAAARNFAEYQSDGMLLAAGFLSLFFAPPGVRPGLGRDHAPSWASLFSLQWLWFQIYFESGFVKMASHDPEWRSLTALDHYYENGPLPNWIGWYAQQMPHWFHAGAALYTLVAELFLVWMLFLPRRFKILCFFIVTPFQLSIILTANLAFLNHLVLSLGVLLLDDRVLRACDQRLVQPLIARRVSSRGTACRTLELTPEGRASPAPTLLFSAFMLTWNFYVTAALLLLMIFPLLPLPSSPIIALEPFRIANSYGLFAVMTTERREIEFQGTRDGKTWIAYPFRYKPQDPSQPPRIHAPYQPRFDWNLWFASLGDWRENPWVARAAIHLLQNDAAVLELFAGNPFAAGEPPRQVRTVVWQYWFTDLATRRSTGLWWQRQFQGLFAPTLEREPNGEIMVVESPGTGGVTPIPAQ